MTAAKKGVAHLKRWMTGLAALAVLIVCVIAGGTVFLLLAVLGAGACLWEYFRIVQPAGKRLSSQALVLCGYAAGLGLILAAHAGRPEMIPVVLGLDVVVCGALSLQRFSSDRTVLEEIARQIQGICYIPLPIALLVLLRSAPDGTTWVFFLCAVIFAGDTAALYAGTLWGRHTLCPAISPGKTVEGALAGLAANLVVGWAAAAIFLPAVGWLPAVAFAAAAGLAGQVGDLFESELKRVSNIKDSGGILPGHGGVLDRIDALLFAAPVAFAFKIYILSS
jgi:phosphatidate cytidylyltransferase